MKKFFMIWAALLIGSMCFAQFSPRQAYKAGTPSTAAVRSSYIGNLSFDQVFYPMSNGEEIAIAPKQYNSSLTGNITKVKFYHHTEDSYTNTSYTIKIYNNISLGGAYTSFGYYDETSCGTAAYTQNYTASENGWQEVELETPYVVPSGEFWVSIQFNGNGIACFGGAASAVEGQYYMKTAVSTYGTFWFAPSLAQQGSSEATLYSCCLAVYVDDGSRSDLEAYFMDTYPNPTNYAPTTMTLGEGENLVLYPAIANMGPDPTDGTITAIIKIDNETLTSSPISQSIPADQAIILTLQGSNSYTIPANYLPATNFNVCIDVEYTGIDPNTENNSSCITVTRIYTITVQANNENMGYVSGGGNYIYGTETTISATPYTGYRFVRWNDNNTDNPRTINVTGSASYTAYFEAIPQYTINAIPSPSSYGYTYGSGTYYEGTEITISATAYEGYRFTNWSDGISNSTRTITVNGNATYTAYFEINAEQYDIDVYSANPNYGYTYGSGTYYGGSSVTIGATAYSGYRFSSWQDGNTDNPRTIIVTDNANYIANFEAIPQYSITVNTPTPNFGTTYGSGTYYEGTEITIWAEAYSGCRFIGWNDGNTNSTRTITVTENATYSAYFEEIPQYTITVRPSNPNYGTTSGGGTYTEGTEITIWAEAYSGCRFVGWNDGNTSATRTITVTDNATYIAYFEEIPQYTITVRPVNPNYGTTWGGGTYTEGTEISFGVEPYEGYRFIGWNDGDTNTTRTITVTDNATYIAILEEIPPLYTITVVPSNPEYGTVYGGGTYERGTRISISAEAYDGYVFTSWNDNNTMNPRTVEVVADATFIANFSDITTVNTYTITVLSANPEYGTVSGSGTYAERTVITISAEPNEGYEFVQWNDGSDRNPRMIEVTTNATFIATFAELPPEPENYTINVYTSNPEQGNVTGGGTFVEGSEITIEAFPNNGFLFTSWDDGNRENPRRITVVGNADYTALFADITTVNTYNISVYSSNPNYGSVAGEGTYAEGTIVTISASANNGYVFKQWNDGNMDNPRQITVVSDATYIATFVRGSAIEESYANEISIFPNPTSDILNITSSEEISSIEIVNVIGQIVLRMDVNSDNAACSVEAINAGVYIVRIYGTNTASVICQRKFIKE